MFDLAHMARDFLICEDYFDFGMKLSYFTSSSLTKVSHSLSGSSALFNPITVKEKICFMI